MKKSIFKRWWFWVIIVVVLIGAIGSGGGNDPEVATVPTSGEIQGTKETVPAPVPTPAPKEKDIWTKAGMYKVGKDLPVGEYLILSDSLMPAYFQLSKDSSGTLDSIITNDNFEGSRYLSVKDGQYLDITGAKFVAITEAPIQEPKDGVYSPGMYKVGRDIKAGEYKVVPDGSMAYLEVSKDSSGSLNSIISNDNFDTEKYIAIAEGQYIKIVGCKLVK